MKNVKTLIAAPFWSSLSFAASLLLKCNPLQQTRQKVGTISATAGTNLGSLEDQLAQKS